MEIVENSVDGTGGKEGKSPSWRPKSLCLTNGKWNVLLFRYVHALITMVTYCSTRMQYICKYHWSSSSPLHLLDHRDGKNAFQHFTCVQHLQTHKSVCMELSLAGQ